MVRSMRKERVWEAPKVKERKKRAKKTKQAVTDENDPSENVSQHQQLQQLNKDQIVVNRERLQHEAHEVENDEQQQEDQQIEQNEEQQNKQLKKEITEEQLKQRLIVKNILLTDLQFNQPSPHNQPNPHNQPYNSFCHRPAEEQTICSFLQGQQARSQPDWLYIYGPPGIGKTYLIKNLLKKLNLQEETVWLNCYSILQKSKLKYSKKRQNLAKSKQIIIIDEFDQLQSLMLTKKFRYKFLEFILQMNEEVLTNQVGKIKYILISNKSYHSLMGKAVDNIKEIMKCERIIERPFLPYPLKAVQKIILKKLNQIETRLSLKFNCKLIQIAVNRMYNISQDIRVVIGFIIQNYPSLLMTEQNERYSEKEMRISLIEGINSRKIETDQNQTMVCKYIKGLSQKQKSLLRQIILQYQQKKMKEEVYKIECVYKQGRKRGVTQQNIDVWLQQWQQMCILTKRRIYPKNQHYLWPVYSVETSLAMKQFKPYFY